MFSKTLLVPYGGVLFNVLKTEIRVNDAVYILST